MNMGSLSSQFGGITYTDTNGMLRMTIGGNGVSGNGVTATMWPAASYPMTTAGELSIAALLEEDEK